MKVNGGNRKVHHRPTPSRGGLSMSIFVAVLAVLRQSLRTCITDRGSFCRRRCACPAFDGKALRRRSGPHLNP